MKEDKKYNIGLDIGTNSVGWCITDMQSNILKRNGKNMWGSRIFESANTAEERRNYRSSRRRLSRRKERINILQSLILDDMEKEYPNFFQILKETSLNSEDKILSENMLDIKYNIFTQQNFNDGNYYKKYPTIYHLINKLIESPEKEDIRLIYLAIHHIIKYRGNFLHKGNFAESTNEVVSKLDIILDFLKTNYDININNKEEFFEILSKNVISKANKKEQLILCFNYEKDTKQVIVNIINAILGYTFDLNKIFNIDVEESKMTFASEIINDEKVREVLQDDIEIYENLNIIYSWYILQDILKGETYISKAFIKKYDKYAADLELLKKVYKKYLPNKYKSMFREYKKDNYVAYNGKSRGNKYKRCKAEEFFSYLKKQIEELPDNCIEKGIIQEELLNNTFLIKLNITDNGEIPYQLYKKEIKIILKNQSKYYTTIKENGEKIIQLLEFRIPYYVGPLAKTTNNWSWLVRRSDEKIRPWNIEQVIDEDATAEAFIRRMTNKCTYLLNEDVIPKQSLLYSKFCVLNELNNIRVNNRKLARDMKKKIIDRLFKERKKVTAIMIKELMKQEMGFSETSITGLQDGNNFNSNMSSYIDLIKIFGEINETNYKECEDIIYWITIFEDKKILRRKIKKEYPRITEEQLNKICKFRYTGWSRLSRKLLIELKAYDGENIMEKLEKTPLNFMQIIQKEEFGFCKQIEELMPNINKKIEYKDIEEIPTSPANKRGIWQTICVVKEIIKIMQCEPQNIYIEFARDEEKKQMKDNRAKQVIKKYEAIENQLQYLKYYDNRVYKELKKDQNNKTLTEKMYLYYIQNGKCLYSGKPLDLDNLNLYEVDHIIPQSYIKDDSLENKALVVREENQRKKDNLLLADEIINLRSEWWKSLYENGFISNKKYFNLIKRDLFRTDDEREKFIQRQLVETRQITKYVTNLLVSEHKNIDIYAIRANLTHGFRIKYDIYKNRNINNYHHAHDAYILSIIGNILRENSNNTKEYKYSEYVKSYFKDEKNRFEKHGMIMNLINKHIDIYKIKKTIQYKDCFISRMLKEETGEFYNQTLYSKIEKPAIPLKENKPVEKYGGYSGEVKAYSVIYSYINNKGITEYELVGIPIQIEYKIKLGKIKIEDYIKEKYLKNINYNNFIIIKNRILKNQEYLDENNNLMRFCSDTEIKTSKELIVNENMQRLIYLMNKSEKELTDNELEDIKQNFEYMYKYLLERLGKEYKSFESSLTKLDNTNIYELEYKDKKSIINALIDLTQKGYANFKLIGLGEALGRKNHQIFKTKKLLNMTFIDKSTTGMYEKRWKINGMENSSSK